MPVVQYIGSDPTWGPQQQVARLRSRFSTNELGVADSDPTIKAPTGGNPYQRLRVRDSAYAAIGANQQWVRKRFSTNELGLADGDPTVHPPWADGSAYLRPAPRQPDQITAQQWLRRRLNTTDLGLADGDPTIRPPWADGSAYLRPAPRQPDAITATNAWARLRLTTNDLGLADADATVRPPWADGSAYLWPAPRQAVQVTATNLWALRRLSTNDVGSADQDTTIRPLWQAANPYTLRLGPSPLPAIEANAAQRRAWTYPVEDSTDFVRPVYRDPYQRRRTDPATWTVEAFTQWMRRRLAPERIYDPFDSDPCIIQDEAGNLILDEAGNDLLLESCGPPATQPTGAGGKWDVTQSSRDAYRKARERQSMLAREDEELLLCLS